MSGKEGAAIQAGCVSVWLSFLFLALDERAPRWPEHSETRAWEEKQEIQEKLFSDSSLKKSSDNRKVSNFLHFTSSRCQLSCHRPSPMGYFSHLLLRGTKEVSPISFAHLLCAQELQGTKSLNHLACSSCAGEPGCVCVHQPPHLLCSSDHTVQEQPWGPHSPAVFPP